MLSVKYIIKEMRMQTTSSSSPKQKAEEQKIKTYKGGWYIYAENKFAKDAAKLAKDGWYVHSQSSSGIHPLTRRVNSIVVVYKR
jgi:hypothetical protein